MSGNFAPHRQLLFANHLWSLAREHPTTLELQYLVAGEDLLAKRIVVHPSTLSGIYAGACTPVFSRKRARSELRDDSLWTRLLSGARAAGFTHNLLHPDAVETSQCR